MVERRLYTANVSGSNPLRPTNNTLLGTIMNLTLRKANAVQTLINDTLKSLEFKNTVTIDEFQNVGETLSLAQDKFSADIARRERLLEALYAIRKGVSQANAQFGIDTKLADIAHLEKQIQFYSKYVSEKVQESLEVIENRLNKIRNKGEGYYQDSITVSLFNANDLTNFKNIVTFSRKQKQKAQDEILELNVQTVIEITEEVEKTLKFEGIL